MYEIKRKDADIDDLMNRVVEPVEALQGESDFDGMTYEEGIAAAVNWLTGTTDTHPLDA